jgi:aspartate/tyrosine/aromatic aminotransferase
MFEQLEMAPPDAILGLTEAFKKDPNPEKVNLGVGVYKDEQGTTPVLACVTEAERRMLEVGATKSYLPISGSADYARVVQGLLLGSQHPIVTEKRAVTVQTPGGTGGLRVAGEFVARNLPGASIWCSSPTWANHGNIFAAAGLQVNKYAYFDKATNGLDFAGMLADLEKIPAGDVVLLHGCCHNPTGIDPTPEQWEQIAKLVAERQLLPLLDFAYQGFGEGIEQDAVGLRALAETGCEMLTCSSFSKNFGLYSERVGALTAIAKSSDEAEVVFSLIKQAIRANYSNPPAHGANIVSTVLSDDGLRGQWEGELAAMRDRINSMRTAFVAAMKTRMPDRDFSFIARQRGMFSFSGLTPVQVDELRSQHAIYIVGSGRINVAGITPSNIDRLCDGIAAVM